MEVTYSKIPKSNLLLTAKTMCQRNEEFRAGVAKPAILLHANLDWHIDFSNVV
jgi:hypothetical protein